MSVAPAHSGPRVSVVIPVRNGAATLGDQLAALAAQRPPGGWEVLVADNGSRDRTRSVAAAWVDRIPVLRVIDASARPGAGAARNIAVEQARGRDLLFCDADDVVSERWVAHLLAALDTHPFVTGPLAFDRLNSAAVRASRSADEGEPGPGELMHAGGGNFGIHADVYRSVGGFDEVFDAMEDADLTLRLRAAGVPLTRVPEAVVHGRLRADPVSAWKQGRGYGVGQRRLAERYGTAVTAGTPGRSPAEPTRHHGGRIARRLVLVARQALAIRGRGDLLRWVWEVGYGWGWARADLSGLRPPDTRIRPHRFPTDRFRSSMVGLMLLALPVTEEMTGLLGSVS